MDTDTQVAADLFPFSNFLEKDVTLKWGGKGYIFKARSTTPLLGKIEGANPDEVRNIRVKFATDIATEAYYDSTDYKAREAQAPIGSGLSGPLYTEADLAPYIQQCLTPLPVIAPVVVDLKEDITKKLKKDERGRLRSRIVVMGEDDLVGEATSGAIKR